MNSAHCPAVDAELDTLALYESGEAATPAAPRNSPLFASRLRAARAIADKTIATHGTGLLGSTCGCGQIRSIRR